MKMKLFLIGGLLACKMLHITAQNVTFDNVRYTLSGDTAIVVGYTGTEDDMKNPLVIPATIVHDGKTYDVTAVARRGLFARHLTSVELKGVKWIGDEAFLSSPDLLSVKMPEAISLGRRSFASCKSLQDVEMPKVVTIGVSGFEYSLRNADSLSMPSVERIDSAAFRMSGPKKVSMPNIRKIASYAFFNSLIEDIGSILKVEEIHTEAFFMAPLKQATIPMNIKHLGTECFRVRGDGLLLTVEDADDIYEQVITDMNKADESENYSVPGDMVSGYGSGKMSHYFRMILPMGKADLIFKKWHIIHPTMVVGTFEVYSPIPLSKSGDGYNTMSIAPDNPAVSCTYEGVTYENTFHFGAILNREDIINIPEYDPLNSPYETPKYSIYIAKRYIDNAERLYNEAGYNRGDFDHTVGTLYLQSPNMDSGFGAGDAFMLHGPAFTGEGEDIVYARHFYKTDLDEQFDSVRRAHPDWEEYERLQLKRNNGTLSTEELRRYSTLLKFFEETNYGEFVREAVKKTSYTPLRYTGENYLKAGTGAAIARESGGTRNFYYTSPTGFWECNNTVIPKGRAYLALPSDLTVNAKQIIFSFEDGRTTTGITTLENKKDVGNDVYYTLQGKRLNGRPTEKGIYIHNGKKEVIK